jgi:hypothetical protein
MAGQEEYQKAKDLYLQDPHLGLEYYATIRAAGDATPQEWEQGLLRDLARQGETAVAQETQTTP